MGDTFIWSNFVDEFFIAISNYDRIKRGGLCRKRGGFKFVSQRRYAEPTEVSVFCQRSRDFKS